MRNLILIAVLFCATLQKCKHGRPVVELCVIGDHNLLCHDERLSEPEYDIEFFESKNYLCTNPNDFTRGNDYITELEEKLKKCQEERRPR